MKDKWIFETPDYLLFGVDYQAPLVFLVRQFSSANLNKMVKCRFFIPAKAGGWRVDTHILRLGSRFRENDGVDIVKMATKFFMCPCLRNGLCLPIAISKKSAILRPQFEILLRRVPDR